MFSSIRCRACGCSTFSQTRGLVVVFGWTHLRLQHGEPSGLCRACAAHPEGGAPDLLSPDGYGAGVGDATADVAARPVQSARWSPGSD